MSKNFKFIMIFCLLLFVLESKSDETLKPKKIIIGIHGLSNKPTKDSLELYWMKSINEGFKLNGFDNNFEFKLIYWADIRYKYPTSENNKDFATTSFYPQHYIPFTEKVKKSTEKAEDSSLDWVTKIMDMDDVCNSPAKSLAATQLGENRIDDLCYYFNESQMINGVSSRIVFKKHVRKQLLEYSKDYDEVMIIAHSMGALIMYEVLHELKDEIKVNTLITIGSPMGSDIINRALLPRDSIPNAINKAWYNLSDEDDDVSYDQTIFDEIDKVSNDVELKDLNVNNEFYYFKYDEFTGQQTDEKIFNPHKSYGYLRCPEISEIINEFLKEEK